MRKPILFAPVGAIALLFVTTAASAQSARFSDIDRNGNGRLSYQELEQAFGRANADRVWSRNGGSELSRQDVSRIYSDRDDDDDNGRGDRGGRDDNDDDDDDGRGGRDDNDDDNDDDDDDDNESRDDDDDDDDDDGGSGGSGGGDDDDDDD